MDSESVKGKEIQKIQIRLCITRLLRDTNTTKDMEILFLLKLLQVMTFWLTVTVFTFPLDHVQHKKEKFQKVENEFVGPSVRVKNLWISSILTIIIQLILV